MPIKVARSHITTRKKCEMRRYLTTDVKGKGVQPKEGQWVADSQLARTRGLLIHGCAERQWRGEDWIKWLKQETERLFEPDFRMIHETLLRRAFLGWLNVRWPFYQAHYDLMSSEKEWKWDISSNIEIPLRMDRIVRNKDYGTLGIVDFKTMKSVDINWADRMKNDDQTLIYVQALKEKSGESTVGIAYEGLVLGEWKDGTQRSPLVQGYKSKATGKISSKYSYGTDRVSLLDYSDEKWLEWMLKADALKDLYPTTGFLLPTDQVLEMNKQSTIIKESEWADRIAEIKLVEAQYGLESREFQIALGHLEKNGDSCLKYGWGHACPFYQVCWQGMGLDAFEPRKDHHEEEEE